MTLSDDDRVVSVWAEDAKGPGWRNPLYWVLVRGSAGKLRLEAIQPNEQSPVLQRVHQTSAALTTTLLEEVK